MTDAHCHVSCGDASVRELLVGRDVFGVHPWDAETADVERVCEDLKARLAASPAACVGEIGLDRLRTREVSSRMRALFEAQLGCAFAAARPVVLHGAKCWGQVIATILRLRSPTGPSSPSFLFHGFSRSDGLIPDIVRLNGYISVGPAVLNDHAVNYRALVVRIPADRLLVETDRTAPGGPAIGEVLTKTAELRGVSPAALERETDENALRFCRGI